ncbi:transcription termination/antitermination protein NusG [Phyllobacterium ifriqiyense]|uniref:transcription termination/antitermination protein NusG n=1 Tax=Phyllobacterium ifriqiyense TaxID=314238 RepID=UPI0033938468
MKSGIDKDKHWYVVRTTVKGEEKAFENIRKVGYDTYLPRQRIEVKNHKTHSYSVRESSLMPRYLFVGFAKKDMNFYRVTGCDGVEAILGIDGCPIPVMAKDVEGIYLAELDMQFDDTREARIHRKEELESAKDNTKREFPAGRTVFVTDKSNPFATFGGVVEEVTKTGKVIALIELFGRMTAVQFDGKQLTPA